MARDPVTASRQSSSRLAAFRGDHPPPSFDSLPSARARQECGRDRGGMQSRRRGECGPIKHRSGHQPALSSDFSSRPFLDPRRGKPETSMKRPRRGLPGTGDRQGREEHSLCRHERSAPGSGRVPAEGTPATVVVRRRKLDAPLLIIHRDRATRGARRPVRNLRLAAP